MPVELYEALRQGALCGGGLRSELQTICYHGMVHGLRLLREQRSEQPRPATRRTDAPPPVRDAVARQLANMILVVHAESAHAY